MGDKFEGGSFNTFLDAIDGSYCTFEGGDSTEYDPQYPDPLNHTKSYKGPENCGGFTPAKVISTSYGYSTEYVLSTAYQLRQCAEYAKLGIAGTSILYSSGDTGVGISGTEPECLLKTSEFGNPQFGVKDNSRFTVGFPANCPYITSVGATMVKNDTSVLAANPEEAANVPLPQVTGPVFIFSSGGGFSDLFGIPNYQKKAIKQYFNNYKPSVSC